MFYTANGNFNSKNIEHFTEHPKDSLKHYPMITPATMYKFYQKKNVAVVNTLNNPFFPCFNPIKNEYIEKFYKKDEFMELEEKNFDLIILYCANYTCKAAKKYAKKLVEKHSSYDSKIVLYEGGVYEMAHLALTHQEYGLYNIDTKKILTPEELYKVIKDYPHWLENNHKGFPQIVYDNLGDKDFYKKLTKTKKVETKIQTKLLEDKVCVVTGATSGLGLETLKAMLNNGAKHVTGTFFNNKERAKKVYSDLVKEFGADKVTIIRADARTAKGNEFTFNAEKRSTYLPKELVPVNCADINAGIYGPANKHFKHIYNIKDEDYDKVMDLNLRGYYLAVKYFSKQAIANNVTDGSIVCIKSIYGSTGSYFSNPAYQISKHGTMGLVRQSAIEMARPNEELGLRHPIRVNAVSPTFTDTALTKPLLKYDKVNDTIANSNTTGNLARKIDVANAVIYLLSDNSHSVTGIDLPVDCGVLAESVPTYSEVRMLNDDENIDTLSCCGDTTD